MRRGRTSTRTSGRGRNARRGRHRLASALETESTSAKPVGIRTPTWTPSVDSSSSDAEDHDQEHSYHTQDSARSEPTWSQARSSKKAHAGAGTRDLTAAGHHSAAKARLKTNHSTTEQAHQSAVTKERSLSIDAEAANDFALLQRLCRACKEREPWTLGALVHSPDPDDMKPAALLTKGDLLRHAESPRRGDPASDSVSQQNEHSILDDRVVLPPPSSLSMLDQLACVLHVYRQLVDAVFRETCEEGYREEYFARVLRIHDRARVHSPLFEALRLNGPVETDATGAPSDNWENTRQTNREGILVCSHCKGSVAYARYAQHLEKCLGGGGRQSSRVAAVRLRQSSSKVTSDSVEHFAKLPSVSNGHEDGSKACTGDASGPVVRSTISNAEAAEHGKITSMKDVKATHTKHEMNGSGEADQGESSGTAHQSGADDVVPKMSNKPLTRNDIPREDDINRHDADDRGDDEDEDEDDDDDTDFTERPPSSSRRPSTKRRPKRRRRAR
ncbi:hypothetical protein CCYA_CCYA09G2567 [Cyanidiococcus yangmingshanensis]|nr:hypothetical protein CCYA_CCYA09G2567 [Cyanidiococcus yangmingshanensis]